MIKFNIKDEKLVLEPGFLMVDAFKAIWDSDKSKKKDKANKLVRFVFHVCDLSPENPIRDIQASEKETEAKYMIYNDREYKFTKKESELLQRAIEAYNKYNITAEERMLDVYNKKIDELRVFISETKPEQVRNVDATNGKVTFTSNVQDLAKLMKEIDGILEAKEKLLKKIKSSSENGKIRGGLTQSAFAQGRLKVNSKLLEKERN